MFAVAAGSPLPPVRLGERASGPPNEGVERVDITRAFGEIVEELLTLPGGPEGIRTSASRTCVRGYVRQFCR
jgi:hypothetical protein